MDTEKTSFMKQKKKQKNGISCSNQSQLHNLNKTRVLSILYAEKKIKEKENP